MKTSNSLILTLGVVAACSLLPSFVAGFAALGAIGGILIAERIQERRKREIALAAAPSMSPIAVAALNRLMREEWEASEKREQQRQAAPNVLWREDRFLRRHG